MTDSRALLPTVMLGLLSTERDCTLKNPISECFHSAHFMVMLQEKAQSSRTVSLLSHFFFP